MKQVCCITIVLLCLAAFAPAPAWSQEPPAATGTLTTRTTEASGFDFDKLKTELNKQKSRQAAADSHAPAKKKDAISAASAGVRMGLYLLALIILFLVISWVVKGNTKKIIPARFLRGLKAKSRSMELLETLNLGQNRTLNLVRVQNQVLVLGLSPQRIQPLYTISDEKAVRNLLETLDLPAQPLADFAKQVDYHLDALDKADKTHA